MAAEYQVAGEKIVGLRRRLKFTQQQMADKAGLTLSGYRRLEYEEQTGSQLTTLQGMASGWGFSDVDSLLGEIGANVNAQGVASPITVAEAEAKLAEVVVRLPPEHDGELSADMRAAVQMLRRGKTPTTTPGKKKGK